jgi:hypothetical protein
MLKAVEKCGIGGKGVRKSNGSGWMTKVKHTHSLYILRNPFEHQFKY